MTALIFTNEMVRSAIAAALSFGPQILHPNKPVHVAPRIARLISIASVVVLAACTPTSGSSGGGNRIVTPAPASKPQQGAPAAPGARGTPGPAPAATTPSTDTTTPAAPSTARVRGSGMSSAELYAGYRAILDTYVDPVDDSTLIKAATDSLRQNLADQGSLPLLTMPLFLVGPSTGNADKDWISFGDAYDSVVSKLPEWADASHPDWQVLRSMAESLHDGHTSFLTPEEAARRNETSFAGIGVLFSRPQNNEPPLIAEIFPNSPASTSGLKRGDRIIKVDGTDVSGKTVADIASLIRGQPGTSVTISVQRLSSQQPLDFTMKRALVQVDQVIGRQVPNAPIGYLKIRSFGDASMVDQVLGILNQGTQRGLRGWVVDLRGNPGGSLQAVLLSAGGFFDASHTVVGYQVDRQRHQTALEIPQPLNLLNNAALVVLVDRDSASGAEIFAAAIQEAKIGTLVGTKTAGNVGVATRVQMPDGSELQVTEQRFVSPSGAALDGVGVTPDVVVDMTDDDLENDRDPQLGKALELIVTKLTGANGG